MISALFFEQVFFRADLERLDLINESRAFHVTEAARRLGLVALVGTKCLKDRVAFGCTFGAPPPSGGQCGECGSSCMLYQTVVVT